MTPYGERIAKMEVEVTKLNDSFEDFKAETKEEFKDVNAKLDTLLSSHDKRSVINGILTWIVGPAFITALIYLVPLFMGKH